MTHRVLYSGHNLFFGLRLVECEKNLWSSISNVAFFTIINVSIIAILSFYISALTEPVTRNLTSDVFELKKRV